MARFLWIVAACFGIWRLDARHVNLGSASNQQAKNISWFDYPTSRLMLYRYIFLLWKKKCPWNACPEKKVSGDLCSVTCFCSPCFSSLFYSIGMKMALYLPSRKPFSTKIMARLIPCCFWPVRGLSLLAFLSMGKARQKRARGSWFRPLSAVSDS